MATPKHFLDLDQVDPRTLRQILDHGKAMKKARANGGTDGPGHDKPLAGKTLAMIFEKPSTRTRVSFEVGMRELGGQTIMLGRTDTQLGRGETRDDAVRVACQACSTMSRGAAFLALRHRARRSWHPCLTTAPTSDSSPS